MSAAPAQEEALEPSRGSPRNSANPGGSVNSRSCLARFWFGLAAFVGLVACSFSAIATTYYVRTDGGTNVQCTGTVNAAYSGSGTGQACAWNNLMEALPPNWLHPQAAMIQGGDTVIIASGSYPAGWQKGYYQRWGDNCNAAYAPACHPQTIPSGTASQPTRILGSGWNTGCTAPPVLWGTQGANYVLSLDGASNVVIACLSITDHSNCTLSYAPNPAYSCVTKATGTGDNDPGMGQWAMKGIHAQDSTNVTLQDVDIHGMADQGVQAGRISNWTVTRVKVRGNGNVGWNGDLGGNNRTSTNSGTLTFTDLHVLWNGCAEQYPVDGTYIDCYGQNEGGYGDGFAEAWTGGNFVFIRPVIQYNTQDGIDLLYANGTGSITVDRGYFGYNAGNDLKTSGNATVTNSIFVGYCNALQNSGMPIAGNGSSGVSGTMCRAGGGELQDMTGPNQTVTFAYNTVISDGGCVYGGDPTSHETGASLDASNVYNIYNNIFIGAPSALPSAGGAYACATYFGTPQPATVNYASNLVWHTRNTTCNNTGMICVDPQLTNEALATFYANPLPSSPAIGNANRSAYSVAWDFYGNPRPANGPLDIGAVAYLGKPFLGNGSNDSPVPPTKPGTTPSSSSAPVPQTQNAPSPNSSEPHGGNQRPGLLRDQSQRELRAERYYRTGAPASPYVKPVAYALPLQPAAAPAQADAATPVHAADTVVPAVAAANAPRHAPVQRSYLAVVFGWFVDVYDEYRHLFAR